MTGTSLSDYHKAKVSEYLKKGLTTVLVDTSYKGVSLPPEFMKTKKPIPLNLSYRFPASDMIEGEQDITVTLTFKGKEFKCVIPYDSILTAESKAKESVEIKKARPTHLKLV